MPKTEVVADFMHLNQWTIAIKIIVNRKVPTDVGVGCCSVRIRTIRYTIHDVIGNISWSVAAKVGGQLSRDVSFDGTKGDAAVDILGNNDFLYSISNGSDTRIRCGLKQYPAKGTTIETFGEIDVVATVAKDIVAGCLCVKSC